MHESDIRSALYRKYFRRRHTSSETLVVDELGLAHGRSRIDVAVINRYIHGYEIKSSRDNLLRLGTQLNVYCQTLQKLTIVTAPRHIQSIASEVPEWCGLIQAHQNLTASIQLTPIRRARTNPDIVPLMQAHLLWRSEVIELLSNAGVAPKHLQCPRVKLYELLCNILTPTELSQEICRFMLRRKNWRDHRQLA